MRRLFSILFLNAWSGMRRTISLLAVGIVAFGVVTLVVLSNIGAGVFAYSSNAAKETAAITHKVLPSSPLAFLSGNPTSNLQKPAHASRNRHTLSSLPVLSVSGTAQVSAVRVAIELDPVLTCTQTSGQSLYTAQSARLTSSTAVPSDGTIDWFWEIQTTNDSGATATNKQAGAMQGVTAGSSMVTIPTDGSQPVLNFTGDGVSTYLFRLHVIGVMNGVSDWVSAAQSGDTCSTN